MTTRQEQSSNFILNDAGEANFKVVAVSYSGAVDWVLRIHDLTRPELQGKLRPVTDHDGWRMVVFDLRLSGLQISGHPVRLHLFGHEGIGFIAQPGSAKDVVYKNAHLILGLAGADDAADLVAVLGGDLARKLSRDEPCACVFAAPAAVPPVVVPAGAVELRVDWRSAPLEPLKATTRILLRGPA